MLHLRASGLLLPLSLILCLLLISCVPDPTPGQSQQVGGVDSEQESSETSEQSSSASREDDPQPPAVQFCGEHVHNDHFQTVRDISHIDVEALPAAVIEVVERDGPPIEEYEQRSVSSHQLRLRSSSPEFPNRNGNYLIATRSLTLALITTGWREQWVIEESEVSYPCDGSGEALDLADDYEVLAPPEGWVPREPSTQSQPEPSELLLRQPLTSLAELKVDQLTVLQIATDILSVIIPGCTDPEAHYNEPRDRYDQVLPTGLTSKSPLPTELLNTVGEGSYRKFGQIDVFQVDKDRIVVIWLPQPEADFGILVVAEMALARRPGDRDVAWRFTEYVEVYGCYEGAVREDETWFSGRAELAQSGLRLGVGMQGE